MLPDAYRANIKAVLETLKPAASSAPPRAPVCVAAMFAMTMTTLRPLQADAVAFITTTPFDMMVDGKALLGRAYLARIEVFSQIMCHVGVCGGQIQDTGE